MNFVQHLQERVLEMLQQLDSGLDAIHTMQFQLAAAKGYARIRDLHSFINKTLLN
jgi:hypothetical protein